MLFANRICIHQHKETSGIHRSLCHCHPQPPLMKSHVLCVLYFVLPSVVVELLVVLFWISFCCCCSFSSGGIHGCTINSSVKLVSYDIQTTRWGWYSATPPRRRRWPAPWVLHPIQTYIPARIAADDYNIIPHNVLLVGVLVVVGRTRTIYVAHIKRSIR